MRNLAYTLLVAALSACAGATSPDLPPGWEAAERVEKLMQMICSESGLSDIDETVSQARLGSELEVTYEHAHFRCEQPVEGYLRKQDTSLDVLVQPIDMHPDKVAACDCRYTITMQVPLEGDTHALTVFRRWDSLTTPNDPVRIGEVEF